MKRQRLSLERHKERGKQMSDFRVLTHKNIDYQVANYGIVSPFLLKRDANCLTVVREDEVQRAIIFLKECTTPSVRKRFSSYVLKHAAEKYTGLYVGNGAFIEAALRLGYRVLPVDPISPNALIYLRLTKNYE